MKNAKFSLICLAVASATGLTYANNPMTGADGYHFRNEDKILELTEQNTVITVPATFEGAGIHAGITEAGKTANVTITGQNLTIELNKDSLWQSGLDAFGGANLVVGTAENRMNSVQIVGTGADAVMGALQAWRGHSDNTQENGGHIEINASSFVIDITSPYARAIYAWNNTTPQNVGDKERASVIVNADKIRIVAKRDTSVSDNSPSRALQAWSQGIIKLTADDIYLEADEVINTRGNSIVEINGKTAQINGKIVFQYDGVQSGTTVDSGININLNGSQSYWTGSSAVEGNPPADKDTVTEFTLGLNNGAQWNATDTSFVNNLNVQDGVINLTKGDGQTVNVDKMTGSNATVNVAATTDDGQTFKTAKLSITRNDVTEYNLSFTGVTADDVKNADAAFAALSASIEAGTDPSSVKIKQNNTIAEGAVRGEMKQTVDENGKKSEVEVSRNTRLTAFESISAMPMLSLRHELNSLNKRMGELRDSPAGIGSWVRLYGSETEYGAQSIESKNTTIQVGSDVSVGDWKVGLAAHYTDGESTYANGQSDSKDYGIALYGTWLAPSGAYVDMIAKYTRIDTDFALNGMDGNYDNNAFTASVEAGYRFNLMDNRVFVEPQVELSYGYVTSTDFTTGNDVRIQQDSFESTIGRIGVRTGYTFPNNKGSVYARVSGVYDFQGEMTGTAALVSDATVREALKEDLGGSWVEYGVGANFNWSDNTYMYVDLERTSSGEVRENYRWNVGLRHVW